MVRSPVLRAFPRLALALGIALASAALAQAGEAPKAPGITGQKPFVVTVERIAAKRGTPAKARVVFTPTAGYHINKEFPTGLKLQPPKGITVDKVELKQKDAALTEQEGHFDITFTASEAGRKVINGTLNFAVCTDKTCNPQRSPVSIEVNVQ